MTNSRRRWRDAAFSPVNTLNHPADPNVARGTFDEHSSIQEEAAQRSRIPLGVMENVHDQNEPPVFGKPSPLRNKLKKESSIFNVPDPRKPRPEHHRPALASRNSQSSQPSPSDEMPFSSSSQPQSQWPQSGLKMSPQHAAAASMITADFFEETRSSGSQPSLVSHNSKGRPVFKPPPQSFENIPPPRPVFQMPESYCHIQRPTNPPNRDIPAAPRPMFSSNASTFKPVNMNMQPRAAAAETSKNEDDDEGDEDDTFDPNKALGEDKFGDYDPLNYVEATQAHEDIRALLEGAIEEDEDDKPKQKLRRPRAKPTQPKSLAQKLEALEVSKEKENDKVTEEEVDDGSVEGLKVKLLPHQIDGVSWMLDKEIGERKKNGVLPNGGILADDMGLGKTIQALSLILSNPKPDKIEDTAIGQKGKRKRKIPADVTRSTLVVAPLALIKQWESEIKTKVLESQKLKVLVHHGPSRKKRADDLKKYDIVITTYQTLSSEHDNSPASENRPKLGCMGVCWWRIILDEAHSIKNRNAKMTKATYALRSVYRWCLTGTPMQNNLDELQSLIRFLQIKPYMELSKWKDHISNPMKNGRGGIAMKRLQYFLKSFMKRRTKDILKQEGALDFGKGQKSDDKGPKEGFQIVERKIQTIVVDFTNEERDTYDKFEARTGRSLQNMLDGKQDYMGALVLLLRLRQLCNHRNLMKGNLYKEGDNIHPAPDAHREQSKSGLDDIDNVAAMMGDLSVQTEKCDICQAQLDKNTTAMDGIHCSDCASDLKEPQSHTISSSKKSVAQKSEKKATKKSRRVIESSDEDEEEAEWLVPEEERPSQDLGKAGGTDDEDAEGEGESLGVENSDTDDDDDDAPLKRRTVLGSKMETSSDISNESDNDDEESEEEDDEDSFEDVKKIDLVPMTSPMMPSAKISRLLEILKESKHHKFIVFSEFTSMLDIVEPFLRDASFRFTRYDGSMRNDDREASLTRLRTDPRTRILLCSLRCGSLGLNLTAASRVVILEPFWNPFVEEQAIDRVHRLNQTRDVVVYKLTVEATVEERILALQEKKRELAKAAIEGGAQAVGKLTMKDILDLFRQGAETREDPDYRGEPEFQTAGYSGGTHGRAFNGSHAASRGGDNSVYGRRWY